MISADNGARNLLAEAERSLQGGDGVKALPLLRRAAALDPKNPDIRLQTALALRLAGDLDGALAELDETLGLDPYMVLAHLSKGFVLEKLGLTRAAAAAYTVALKCAPPPAQTPPGMRAPLDRAREIVARHTGELARHLRGAIAGVRERHGGEKLERFDRALEIYAGKRQIYYPQPMLLAYPELPPIQFYDRDLFPWLAQLEAATDDIRTELMAVLEADWNEFRPYIEYPKGAPVAQWNELNHSPRWSSFFLWENGRRIDAHCDRCPKTAEILGRLPMADQPGFAPSAMFSVLQPRTRIPPHTGSTNTRLVVHLPLVLPGQCGFRVGNETREWKMGEAWVFDDTMEHEAWNDSGHVRVILIFDVWNPFLSQAERDLVSAMMTAKNAWMTAEAKG
jgi:aspartyl/asparaginyl beta-hydroxylase (cupin superfamily)